MTAPVSFSDAASVVLDANGNGTVSLGPKIQGQKWNLSVAAIRTSTANKIPQCSLYMGGPPDPSNMIDGTYSGDLNSSSRVDAFPLFPGQKLYAVWTGGDPGATATLSVVGTVERIYRHG